MKKEDKQPLLNFIFINIFSVSTKVELEAFKIVQQEKVLKHFEL